MAINNLLASPGFAAWLSGEPLDVQRLLFTAAGKPRISVISIAHLSDQERMFIVTLLLNEVIAWMRSQSGTSSLRAILYMDEIFGYFPPTANPPSKQPMLTLLKQARAFGVGCVLATQNPVDLDYKGLANAGTWMIGRLQTERDKLRVLEGLESAVPGSDRAALDKMISGLTPRVFLMRNVHDDTPVLFQSRWALSYLRGPLTGVEISKLMAPLRSATPAPAATPARAPANEAASRPSIPADVPEYFLCSRRGGRIAALQTDDHGHRQAALRRCEARARSVADDCVPGAASRRWWPDSMGRGSDRSRAEVASRQGRCALLHVRAGAGRRFAHAIVCSVGQSTGSAPCSKALAAKSRSRCAQSNVTARHERRRFPSQTRARRARTARCCRSRSQAEVRTETGDARGSATPQPERIERERSQLVAAADAVGVLDRRFRARRIARTSNAVRGQRESCGISGASSDADRSRERRRRSRRREPRSHSAASARSAAAVRYRCRSVETRFDATAVTLRKVQISPRKSDIAVGEVALVWTPWRKGADGFPTPAS
jgi:hypothetical protein